MFRKTVLAAAAAAAFVAGAVPGAVRAETSLTYGSSLPAPHVIHEKALAPFFERVAEDTGGALRWELIPGGTMGSVKEAVQTVEDGIVDSGLVLDIYTRQELPVTSMFADMIALPDDFIVFAAAANEMQLVACEACRTERADKGLVSLAYYAPDPYLLMCADDTRGYDDLQNKKTRASGRMGVLVETFGATTVTIPSSEVYEALQRGQASCSVASAAWLESYNLSDVVTNIIDLPMGSYFNAGLLYMNKATFDGLPEDHKAAIRGNLAKLVADALFAYRTQSGAALAEAQRKGVALVEPDQKLTEALAEFRDGEIANTVATAEEAGLDGAAERVETFMALVGKWRGIVAETGDDEAAFADALDREIFSRAEF